MQITRNPFSATPAFSGKKDDDAVQNVIRIAQEDGAEQRIGRDFEQVVVRLTAVYGERFSCIYEADLAGDAHYHAVVKELERNPAFYGLEGIAGYADHVKGRGRNETDFTGEAAQRYARGYILGYYNKKPRF